MPHDMVARSMTAFGEEAMPRIGHGLARSTDVSLHVCPSPMAVFRYGSDLLMTIERVWALTDRQDDDGPIVIRKRCRDALRKACLPVPPARPGAAGDGTRGYPSRHARARGEPPGPPSHHRADVKILKTGVTVLASPTYRVGAVSHAALASRWKHSRSSDPNETKADHGAVSEPLELCPKRRAQYVGIVVVGGATP
jgi:hypothetical protein